MQIIIKLTVAEFIFIKVSGFYHIFLNKFRRMTLKFENYSSEGVLFYIFK